MIQDPAAGSAVGALINQLHFNVLVRSLKRLQIALRVVRYYNSVGRKLTEAKIRWTLMHNFNV